MVVGGDAPTIAASMALLGVALVFGLAADQLPDQPAEDDPLRLVSSPALTLEQVAARPGGVLVAHPQPERARPPADTRSPCRASGDVIVMTIRVIGPEGGDDDPHDPRPTISEQELFSHVVALAERHERPVRLLIVPAYTVSDATVSAVLRLQVSDVFVGESSTLSAEAQARLLGDAWERAETGELHGVRLVVHHRSGRTDTFHLGAHAPELSSRDLDLIHHVWLDAVKALGPARSSPRRGAGGTDANGRTTERTRSGRRAARCPDRGATGRRARRYRAGAELRAPAGRHPQSSGGARGHHAGGPQHRGPGAGLPASAAEGRRGGVRVSLPRRAGAAAEGHGAGGRGVAPQRNGAGRPHDVPRGAAGAGHAPAARAC